MLVLFLGNTPLFIPIYRQIQSLHVSVHLVHDYNFGFFPIDEILREIWENNLDEFGSNEDVLLGLSLAAPLLHQFQALQQIYLLRPTIIPCLIYLL